MYLGLEGFKHVFPRTVKLIRGPVPVCEFIFGVAENSSRENIALSLDEPFIYQHPVPSTEHRLRRKQSQLGA